MAKMFPPSIKGYKPDYYNEIEMYMFLKYILPDDYYVFYNIRVHESKPDFVIVGPELGLIVLEVKAWSLNYISTTNARFFKLKNETSEMNPYEQADKYRQDDIEYVLKMENSLLQTEGIYKGKIKFPRTSGVVFTNIEKSAFLNNEHKDSIDQKHILFKDEIERITDERNTAALIEKLKNMFDNERSFQIEPLSLGDMAKIRKIIYRESGPCNDREVITDENIDDLSPQHNETINTYEISPSSAKLNVKKKNRLGYRDSKKYKIIRKIKIILAYVIVMVFMPYALHKFNDICSKYNFPKVFAGIIENYIEERTEIPIQNQEDKYIESQPIMVFKVGSHPGAKGTYIHIKDSKKYLVSKIFTEGSVIEFYEDKKIIINDVKSDKEEFIVENDVIDLEVGNTYTKIYLNGEECKFAKNFKYDFVNKVIVK